MKFVEMYIININVNVNLASNLETYSTIYMARVLSRRKSDGPDKF